MQIEMNDTWTLGKLIGSGGFGKVFQATNSQGLSGAVKLIPKSEGAGRDLLVQNLEDVRNVVRILDQGETEDSWALVMALADMSLRDYLENQGGTVTLSEAIKITEDVSVALSDMKDRVVHRDIKPENILLLDGTWSLTDFGISRYAEATTAQDTKKFALSPPYAAPERWQNVRATTATDIYSLGVICFEILSGQRPFEGPSIEDYREQHLNVAPPRYEGDSTRIADIIEECLMKAMASRPLPEQLIKRLQNAEQAVSGSGLSALQQANQGVVREKSIQQAEESRNRDTMQTRSVIFDSAKQEFVRICSRLKEAITDSAPSVQVVNSTGQHLRLVLGQATLDLNEIKQHAKDEWGGWDSPPFDVVAYASIDVTMTPANNFGYEGRGHSLWYCDAQERGVYAWYEVAFMVNALIPKRMLGTGGGTRDPFQLDPGVESAKALWNGMAEFSMARPFER
jgi:serine/threonine protein kinase